MQQRDACRGPQSIGMQFVNMPALQSINFQLHRFAILSNIDPADHRFRVIHFRASV